MFEGQEMVEEDEGYYVDEECRGLRLFLIFSTFALTHEGGNRCVSTME